MLGYRVVLVTAARRPGDDRVEMLPPSIALLAETLPLVRALAQAESAPVTRLHWSGKSEEARANPDTRLVRRAAFDAALDEAAVAAGAIAIRPARVRRPRPTGQGWMVPIQTVFGPSGIATRFFVDATGRAGGLGGASRRVGPATVALSARWNDAGLAPGTVLVEALQDAWCWGAATADGGLETAVFVDMRSCAGRGRAALSDWQASLLRESTLFGPAVQGRRPDALSLCDATPRTTDAAVGPDVIRVGDAAFAPDPLSSQGVQCALRAGVQAAVVVHTILSGGDAEAAMAFYRETVRNSVAAHHVAAAGLYATHQTWQERAFWRTRAAGAEGSRATAAGPDLAPDAIIRLAPEAAVGSFPALVGERIERVPAICNASERSAIAWIDGLPVTQLLGGMEAGRHVSDIVASWSWALAPDRALFLMQVLLSRGILTRCDPGPF